MLTFRIRIVATWFIVAAAFGSAHGAEVRLVVERPLPIASARALTELREALVAHGDEPDEAQSAADQTIATIIIGLAGQSPAVDEALAAAKEEVAKMSEAAAIVAVPSAGDAKNNAAARTFVLAGHDDRGLTYALRDAARGIAVLPKEKPWHAALTPAVEQPFLKVRNVSVHLFNADCEREWFFSEEFWRFYFQRLSLSRFNRCTLTFCDQTNYLCPPYAYLVEMPEYPEVKVADCTPEQRAQNLAMVRRIAELADEYAVDFDLGIWMQAPVAKWAAPVQVSGLPEGMKLAEYCALGLRRILEACPSIDGLQLRMNAEAGVPEDQQTAFYKPMFQTMATYQTTHRNGRPLRLDLRYKGLTDETINAALEEKLDVTVSTKFWSEHLGMPYHPTTVDSHYAKDRYSFGTLLKKPRLYKVTYQLWNVGSNRLTLWGDPAYAAQFAKSCTLSGGEGFEVFAPLTNKGYGNKPGAWPVIKNPEYRVGKWEQERYWAFYLCFGRMGYNPQSSLEFWDREFRHRFGKGADSMAAAYRNASQILPLITTALLPSASEWYWWPEMDTGDKLREYARIQTSDPGRFAAIQSWEKTPEWRWEEWDKTPGYFERQPNDLIGPGNRAPVFVISDELLRRSNVLSLLAKDGKLAANKDDPETLITHVDMELLSELGRFHAYKLRSATAVFTVKSEVEPHRTIEAAFYFDLATKAWREIVALTKDVYHDDLVFGITPDMPRSKFGHHHSGHWRDRLAEIEAEREVLAARLHELHVPRTDHERILDFVKLRHDSSLRSPDELPTLIEPNHSPPKSFDAGRPMTLELQFPPNFKPKYAAVHVRPLDQTRPWRPVAMLEQPGGVYSATLPADAVDPHFDLQYYFQIVGNDLRGLVPRDDLFSPPYFVVPVETK